jgi:hypothetical protein
MISNYSDNVNEFGRREITFTVEMSRNVPKTKEIERRFKQTKLFYKVKK